MGNEDNYLYMSNDNTELEIGQFHNSNVRISGKHSKTFLERFLNLFTGDREVEFDMKFDAEELRDISNVTRNLYLKDLHNNKRLVFNIERTSNAAIIPSKAHSTDVGYDLYNPFEFTLYPNETRIVNFHIRIGLEPGWEAQVRNRSSLPSKFHTMMVIGTVTIDPGYRGEIMAPFYNFGRDQMIFRTGSKIAQLVIKKTEDVVLKEGKVNMNTERGEGGFGSTGV